MRHISARRLGVLVPFAAVLMLVAAGFTAPASAETKKPPAKTTAAKPADKKSASKKDGAKKDAPKKDAKKDAAKKDTAKKDVAKKDSAKKDDSKPADSAVHRLRQAGAASRRARLAAERHGPRREGPVRRGACRRRPAQRSRRPRSGALADHPRRGPRSRFRPGGRHHAASTRRCRPRPCCADGSNICCSPRTAIPARYAPSSPRNGRSPARASSRSPVPCSPPATAPAAPRGCATPGAKTR